MKHGFLTILVAGLTAAGLGICAFPMPLRAEELTVPADGSANGEVTATFTIDDEVLAGLGYNVIASIPVTLPLSYNSAAKNFSNEGTVYCSGILPTGKKVTVTVNESGEKYGKIYDPSNAAESVAGQTGFDVTLSRTTWTKADCYTNLTKRRGGDEATETGSLSVTVPGSSFIPKATGTFKTYVPLVIRQEADE